MNNENLKIFSRKRNLLNCPTSQYHNKLKVALQSCDKGFYIQKNKLMNLEIKKLDYSSHFGPSSPMKKQSQKEKILLPNLLTPKSNDFPTIIKYGLDTNNSNLNSYNNSNTNLSIANKMEKKRLSHDKLPENSFMNNTSDYVNLNKVKQQSDSNLNLSSNLDNINRIHSSHCPNKGNIQNSDSLNTINYKQINSANTQFFKKRNLYLLNKKSLFNYKDIETKTPSRIFNITYKSKAYGIDDNNMSNNLIFKKNENYTSFPKRTGTEKEKKEGFFSGIDLEKIDDKALKTTMFKHKFNPSFNFGNKLKLFKGPLNAGFRNDLAEYKYQNISLDLKNFYSLSVAGKSQNGFTKINQDNYLNLTNLPYPLQLFGVFDGHGDKGHKVSDFLKNFFKDYFINSKLAYDFKEKKFTSNQILEYFMQNDYCFIKNLYSSAEKKLSSSITDIEFSGSTCILVFIIGDYVLCSNVGDSRAIMINGDYKVIPLSRDHKPELQDEKERIIQSGGTVDKIVNPSFMGPYRVWVKNKNYPGLAMSRSIGDLVAESVGVICEPEIKIICCGGNCENNNNFIGTECKCIVICSDGVWEFCSNDKVKGIIMEKFCNFNSEEAAYNVYNFSKKMWDANGNLADDITVTVIFF